MKHIAVLFAIFLAIALFVYFYEYKGQEVREEAENLEESLLRLRQDEIRSVEISRPDEDAIRIQKEGDGWVIKKPIETLADGSTVDLLLSNLEEARRERTFTSVQGEVEKYGFQEPRMKLKVQTEGDPKTLLVGLDDFTGSNMYVQVEGVPEVFLTSDQLFTLADKELSDWRSKKILIFERSQVRAIEITAPTQQIHLTKQGDTWVLESPIQEKADQSSVSSLLSKLEFAEAQEFVSETGENLRSHGLDRPSVSIRIQHQDEDSWRTLEFGNKQGETYLAHNPDQSPVFTVKEDVFQSLSEEVWQYRDKDVVDVEQDEVTQLTILGGESEIALRREESKWIVEKPGEQKDKEALSYKFWYPIDDLEFESIESSTSSEFPEPDISVVVTLKDGSTRTFEFVKNGDQYLARRVDSGRRGTLSQESFEKIQLRVEDIVEADVPVAG